MTSNNTPEDYMRLALDQAKKAPPKPTNFCVGAVLVSSSSEPQILAVGHTMELPGNTHAEQCALQKIAQAAGVPEDEAGKALPDDTVIYTTMEPCNMRLSGNAPCVDRILQTRQWGGGIQTVYLGVKEPEKFVGENQGRKKLEDAGIQVVHLSGFEDEILRVATAGHDE